MIPAARNQLVTVRRPWARMIPTTNRWSRQAFRPWRCSARVATQAASRPESIMRATPRPPGGLCRRHHNRARGARGSQLSTPLIHRDGFWQSAVSEPLEDPRPVDGVVVLNGATERTQEWSTSSPTGRCSRRYSRKPPAEERSSRRRRISPKYFTPPPLFLMIMRRSGRTQPTSRSDLCADPSNSSG